MHVSSRFKIPGQLAQVTPIAISAAITTGKPIIHPPKNVYKPMSNENIVIYFTKPEIYFYR